MTEELHFSLDTSALINPWRRMWPVDLTPGFWSGLRTMSGAGRLILSEEVREELDRKDDELAAWARTNIAGWHPITDPIQESVRDIMERWGRLVDQRPNQGSADPFVIATAHVTGSIVVTDEGPGTDQKPKIPYVCAQLHIPCIGLLEFVRTASIRLAE